MVRKSPHSKKGLTLLEVIVVMAIIAIVASMLIPGLARARRNADRTKCINNLKNIGLIVHIYALDYHNRFPTTGGTGKQGLTILKTNYITDNYGFICSSSITIPPGIDYFFADELNENSPEDSPLAVDDAPRHDSPKIYNVMYVDSHIESFQTPPTGVLGETPVD